MTHKACSLECAQKHAEIERVKSEKKETRERLEKLRTKRDYVKIAQIAFNAYIRERDKNQLCICCDKPLGNFDSKGGAYDAGHYRSVGSAPHLRYNEDNCHGQRKVCNQYGAGRAVDYRIGLIKRIGIDRVEALESNNAPRKYSVDELKEIAAYYRKKLKELKNNGEN